tara:strand:+ start:6705 stop:7361 length:657 start_codon:yes stop_codon:yes gene_type:complete
MFKNYIAETTIQLFSSLFGNSKQNTKYFIIDPFTCMVRLAILSFKPKGTKISIIDNMIKYNDPTILQGTIRWTQGDNRDDLHNLYRPITKAIEWYNLDDEKIQHIFNLSSKGIDNLMNSYTGNSTVHHSLVYYKTIIDENLKEEKEHPSPKEENYNKIYTELKSLWNKNEINIINDILSEMEHKTDDDKQSLINAIDSIINIKEKRVQSIIKKNTTVL